MTRIKGWIADEEGMPISDEEGMPGPVPQDPSPNGSPWGPPGGPQNSNRDLELTPRAQYFPSPSPSFFSPRAHTRLGVSMPEFEDLQQRLPNRSREDTVHCDSPQGLELQGERGAAPAWPQPRTTYFSPLRLSGDDVSSQ